MTADIIKHNYSTKQTLIGRIADYLGVNKKFNKYQDDKIDRDPNIIMSPVEATFVDYGRIENGGEITSKSAKKIRLDTVIGKQAILFSGGTYYNFYLSPKNKHYWRIPYDCEMFSTQINDGKPVFPVLIGLDKIFKGNRFFAKAIIKNASIGSIFNTEYFTFAMIPIGSLNVNGIHLVKNPDGKYRKGDIGGYFSVGSSMLLCFPDYPLETLIKIGVKVNIGDAIIKFKELKR